MICGKARQPFFIFFLTVKEDQTIKSLSLTLFSNGKKKYKSLILFQETMHKLVAKCHVDRSSQWAFVINEV